MDMNQPRCLEHRDRPELPRLCSVCQRLTVEADIVTRTVDALLGAGFFLQTDITDDARPAVPTRDREAILSEMMEVDDEYLGAFPCGLLRVLNDDPRPSGWVRFVYGNDGWDVMSDYTTNLESVLAPINAYADTLA